MKQFLAIVFVIFMFRADAQLSADQKLVDFQQLVALYAKRYSFYEWKRDAVKFDGLRLQPWLDRVRASKDDIEFFEICAEYVASYQDGHAYFLLPSTFEASLGFSSDIYDGKVLIDSIDRNVLPEAEYPFQIGDQIIRFDGKPVLDAIRDLAKFLGEGNERSQRRFVAGVLTERSQSSIPRAHELGDNATVVIQRQTGPTETFNIPWKKTGFPYRSVGPVPTPRAGGNALRSQAEEPQPDEAEEPRYLRRLRSLQNYQIDRDRYMVGFGEVAPVFDMPAGFLQRLGTGRFDTLYTGTFETDGVKIGFLRIPHFSGFFNRQQFEREIAFFEANTDGLIIDVMRNPGGSACNVERMTQRLTAEPFRTLGVQIRVTWDLLLGAQLDLDEARLDGASESVIAELENYVNVLREAFNQNRGLTTPIPLCSASLDVEAAKNADGAPIGYSKPIFLLTDELSFSAAELFAAILQDNGRAHLYGMRTDGAGGAVSGFAVGHYMEGSARLARTIATRKANVVTTEYPPAPFIENIGVRPDTVADYMTTDNLLNKGKTFVANFTKAATEYIKSKK